MSSDKKPKCNEDANTSSIQPQTNVNIAIRCAPTTSKPLRLGVFISGSGRTLKNLIDCSGSDFEVVCVASDRPCLGINHAERAGITTNYNAAIQPTAELRDEVLWEFVQREGIDYLCLAGYLSLLNIPSNETIRVLNIHPALIPKFGGKGMYGSKVHKAILASDDAESGCTVHFCDNEYDHGEIILQKKLSIDPAWDHHQLAAEVFKLEKLAYPEAISSLRIA